MNKFHIALTGILCIAGIVVACIIKGIDGTIIASGCAIIGTLVGYCFKEVKDKVK